MSTPRLSLPLVAANQAQKHVTVNEALLLLDSHVHLHLEAVNAVTPPSAPAEGIAYALGAAPTGAWVGHGGKVARVQDGFWTFWQPKRGWRATVGTVAAPYTYDGTTWKAVVETGLAALEAFGLGTTAGTSSQRLSVRSANILFEGNPADASEPGDVRLKLNKTAPTDIASILFQTGYSGRAEIAQTADEKFCIRTSLDGATFQTALSLNPNNGTLSLPRQTAFRAIRTGADGTAIGPNGLVPFNATSHNTGSAFNTGTSKFTAAEDGLYLITVSVFADTANSRTIIDLIKNGTTGVGRAERADVGGAMELINLTTILPLISGDTLEVRAFLGSVRITQGHFTWFCGAKLA